MTATATKERPILFSGAMVRAILDGRKTQTRRIVKLADSWDVGPNYAGECWPVRKRDNSLQRMPCPCGSVGDRLWVTVDLSDSVMLKAALSDLLAIKSTKDVVKSMQVRADVFAVVEALEQLGVAVNSPESYFQGK